MKKIGKLPWLLLILSLLIISITPLQAQPGSEEPENEEAILVGRLSHVEGRLLRFVPDVEDWVATVKDAPFGMDDALHSDEGGRAELIMPNNTWVRIDGDTQIQLIVLKEDVTGIDVASGVVRFYNKSSNTVIKATTPFGYVTAPAGTSFDLYVGDDSVEVIALKGTVEFVHTPDGMKFEVIAGSSTIVADSRQVTTGEGYGDPDWERWNRDRDNLWRRRAQRIGESAKYLPPTLQHEAYVLDEYGRWVKVYYEGAYRYFWRPIHVGIGWAPFSVGRWTVWHEDHCWIPAEPFGYVTHHYGNWVLVSGTWYWAPPVARVRARLGHPLPYIGFAWYPGRVAWIHFGIHIGWVPLAPSEFYYSHHRWGRRAVVVKHVNIRNIDVRIKSYRYVNRAIIIDRNNLYRVNSYKRVRTRNINSSTIINKYRVAPIINNTVISNYAKNRQRYNFRNVNVTRKPHRIVIKRISNNQVVAKASLNVNAKTIRQTVKNIGHGKLVIGAKIRNLRIKSRMVPKNQVNKPASEVRFRERNLKRRVSAVTKHKEQGVSKVQQETNTSQPLPAVRKKAKAAGQNQAQREATKERKRGPPVSGKQVWTRIHAQQVQERHYRRGGHRLTTGTVAAKAAKKTDTTQVERGKKIISVGQVNRLATEVGSGKRKIKRKAREPVKDKEQTVAKVQRKGKRSRSLPGTERKLKLKGEKKGENQVKKARTRKAPAYREGFRPGNQKQQAHARQARKDKSEFRKGIAAAKTTSRKKPTQVERGKKVRSMNEVGERAPDESGSSPINYKRQFQENRGKREYRIDNKSSRNRRGRNRGHAGRDR